MHQCTKFRGQRKEGDWRNGELFREREVENTYACVDCGRERRRRFRKVIALERESKNAGHGIPTASLRFLARKVESACKNSEQIRAAPFMKRMGGVRIEAELEELARYAPIRLVYTRHNGGFRLHGVHVLDRAALSEVAHPGTAAKRVIALASARQSVAQFTHPAAQSIRQLLDENGSNSLDERVVTALAGLAQLVDSGETMPLRAFSAKVLRDSKAFSRIRGRVERITGPVERLGIRESGGLVLMGGAGILRCANGDIAVDSFRCVGCSSEDVLETKSLEIPTGGALLVENLTPFHACIEQLSTHKSLLVLWLGGFPNRGVSHLIRRVATYGVPVRVWCDIDLSGIRIARLVHKLTDGKAEPVLMQPCVVESATQGCKIPDAQLRNIEHDLKEHPDAILADTLRILLERGEWFEQEAFLSYIPQLVHSGEVWGA